MSDQLHIAVVDDDEAVIDSLRLYFARHGVEASCFASAGAFLTAIAGGKRFDCIVSDVRMPGMSGLDLVRSLKGSGLSSPVILITGHGDIDMAVAAIKVGAFDFIEKPFDEARLLDSIRNAMAARAKPEADAVELEKLQARFGTLSTRQRQVMEFAVAGLSNKEIASKLKISPKTVENHRAWVMERIGARNIADLVRIAMKVEESKNR
ncbi:MAG TPA: response regulator [Pseudolabrys sp.]|jgi:two-component system response regulator FixJ|nr:response regulator [Pseudolabrys sp.]